MYFSVISSDCNTASDSFFFGSPPIETPANEAKPPNWDPKEFRLLSWLLLDEFDTGDTKIVAEYCFGNIHATEPIIALTTNVIRKIIHFHCHKITIMSLRLSSF